jgi:hypothetical protein
MFDHDSITEPVLQRIRQQEQVLARALTWSVTDIDVAAERPPTPLHADLALFVAIANGELDRAVVDNQALGAIIERFQGLLDLLFRPAIGYYGYSIPPNFWTTTPLGQVLARVQAWLRHDDLLSYSEAARLLFPDLARANLQAARMRVKRLVERGDLQGYVDPLVANPTQQTRVSRQAAEALRDAGQLHTIRRSKTGRKNET